MHLPRTHAAQRLTVASQIPQKNGEISGYLYRAFPRVSRPDLGSTLDRRKTKVPTILEAQGLTIMRFGLIIHGENLMPFLIIVYLLMVISYAAIVYALIRFWQNRKK